VGSPVGGATGVLYARRSADGIFTGGRTESGLAQFSKLIRGQVLSCNAGSFPSVSLSRRICRGRIQLSPNGRSA